MSKIDGMHNSSTYKKDHYENSLMEHTAFFQGCKNDNFRLKSFDYFHIFAQNIDCGYKLGPPHSGGSNECPQSMF